MDDFVYGFGKGRSMEWQFPGKKLIEQDGGREDIGSSIDSGKVGQLFWGTVMDRPHKPLVPGFDQFRFLDSGNTEIRDLHGPVVEQDNVAGLDIAMYNPMRVGKFKAGTNLGQ